MKIIMQGSATITLEVQDCYGQEITVYLERKAAEKLAKLLALALENDVSIQCP